MTPARHTEVAFESVIEAHLLAHGSVAVAKGGCDPAAALFPAEVLDFIQETQVKEWARLEALHGEKAGGQVVGDLVKWMEGQGALATLRHGFKCDGRTLRVAFWCISPWMPSRSG